MSEVSDLADYISAYAALISLATISIYAGSFASLPRAKRKGSEDRPDEGDDEDEESLSEEIRLEDAYWFPILGSVVLLGLYLIIKYISIRWINVILQWYFSVVTVSSVWKVAIGTTRNLIGRSRWKKLSHFTLSLEHDTKLVFKLRYPTISILLAPLALYPATVYLFFPDLMERQHSALIDIMGLSLCHMALSSIKLDSLITGVVLLSGLFFYDIWWVFGSKPVFGSNVMVTVARGLDAPIKILWPKSMHLDASNGYTMLGLGDIVVPGLFIAFALRYDLHRSTHQDPAQSFGKPFFTATLISYVLGLITTVVVMHNFQSAQPALLYLSPACVLSFLGTGQVLGLTKDMWKFSDTKKAEEKSAKSE